MINHADGPTYIEPLDEEHAIKRDVGRGLPHIAYKRMPDTGASCPVTGGKKQTKTIEYNGKKQKLCQVI